MTSFRGRTALLSARNCAYCSGAVLSQASSIASAVSRLPAPARGKTACSWLQHVSQPSAYVVSTSTTYYTKTHLHHVGGANDRIGAEVHGNTRKPAPLVCVQGQARRLSTEHIYTCIDVVHICTCIRRIYTLCMFRGYGEEPTSVVAMFERFDLPDDKSSGHGGSAGESAGRTGPRFDAVLHGRFNTSPRYPRRGLCSAHSVVVRRRCVAAIRDARVLT